MREWGLRKFGSLGAQTPRSPYFVYYAKFDCSRMVGIICIFLKPKLPLISKTVQDMPSYFGSVANQSVSFMITLSDLERLEGPHIFTQSICVDINLNNAINFILIRYRI